MNGSLALCAWYSIWIGLQVVLIRRFWRHRTRTARIRALWLGVFFFVLNLFAITTLYAAWGGGLLWRIIEPLGPVFYLPAFALNWMTQGRLQAGRYDPLIMFCANWICYGLLGILLGLAFGKRRRDE